MATNEYAIRGACVAGFLLFLSGCAPSAYVVKTPTPSGLVYESVSAPSKASLTLIDNRKESERVFHSGRLNATLNVDDAPLDATKFLAVNLEKELASRGLPTHVSQSGQQQPVLRLNAFRIQNHRATGFSPFVTFTLLSADLETGDKKERVAVFIKRGKIPVWSFDEIIEPTFNQPLSLATKELASKIVNQLYNYRASDKAVADIEAKIAKRGVDAYLDVYALGFTNNPKAIQPLMKLIGDTDEYVRLAAISSLGNLRANSQFEYLKSLYQNRSTIWQDRGMAIKAIGDLNTPEAKAFLAAELKYLQSQPSSNESDWNMQIIRLYL